MYTTSTFPPTYTGYVETRKDALILIQACLRGDLHPVDRRPVPDDRYFVLQSGNVYLYEEKSSGIRRWLDSGSWTTGRTSRDFSIYAEKPDPNCSPHQLQLACPFQYGNDKPLSASMPPEWEARLYGSLRKTFDTKAGGLVRKTICIKNADKLVSGPIWHLVNYYRPMDVVKGRLRTPSKDKSLAPPLPPPLSWSRQPGQQVAISIPSPSPSPSPSPIPADDGQQVAIPIPSPSPSPIPADDGQQVAAIPSPSPIPIPIPADDGLQQAASNNTALAPPIGPAYCHSNSLAPPMGPAYCDSESLAPPMGPAYCHSNSLAPPMGPAYCDSDSLVTELQPCGQPWGEDWSMPTEFQQYYDPYTCSLHWGPVPTLPDFGWQWYPVQLPVMDRVNTVAQFEVPNIDRGGG